MKYTPGIDVSRYEGAINWNKVKAAGYKFAVIRATVGDYYTDPTFYTNWSGAKKAGLYVSVYHVVVATKYAVKQIDRLYSVLDGRKSDFPVVLDIERDDNVSDAGTTACIRDCIKHLAKHDSRKPIIYTAYYYWKDHVEASSEWAKYGLWVASYNTKPIIPPGWSNWKFWQYSESGKVSGVPGGVDLDWFNGTYDDLVKYVGHKPTKPSTSNALSVRVVASVVNVRSGPGIKNSILGTLKSGKVINLTNISGNNVWVEFKSGWAACCLDGNKFMKILPGAKASDGIKARILVDRLNIRSGPSTSSSVTGILKKGDEIRITALSGKDVWVQYDKTKWAAFFYGTGRYMENA